MAKDIKDEIIEKLQTEVESLRSIISLMPGTVYWKDTKGLYQGCNSNLAQLLNLKSPDDIIGKTLADIIPSDAVEKISHADLEVLQTEKEKCLEEYGYDAQGAPAVYLTRKTPYYDHAGKLQGLLGVSFDITDRKQIEEKLKVAKNKAEAANRAKSRFLAMISHELRTPLTSVLGFANLIEQANLQGENCIIFLKHIINSGSYLLSLINSLLDYNKLETNKFELMFLPLNLKELVENVVSLLSGSAELKNLQLNWEYDPKIPEQVMGNSRILRQILVNLIGNALKFTETGSVTIKVQGQEITEQSAKLFISVTDTGIGVPEKDQQLIFKRFYQVGDVYTRNTNLTGTGLGLSLVKKLVKLLGGKIQVKSIPGEGSTFYFTIDFLRVAIGDSPWLPYASNVRILVIQDSSNKNIIHRMLTNTIHDIVSSQETLNQLFSAQQNMQPYDILIIDEALEMIQPNELLRMVQEHYDLHQPLPILLTSGTYKSDYHFEIPTKPTDADIVVFQKKLKSAWEKRQADAKKAKPHSICSSHPHILLIEDNELIQLLHKHMLEELGYLVDTCDSYKKAMEMVHFKYDLFLVDIGLPDISGFDLIKALRKEALNGKDVPIIVLTGYSEEEERQRCLRAGADEVAIKPISKSSLETLLNQYLKR